MPIITCIPFWTIAHFEGEARWLVFFSRRYLSLQGFLSVRSSVVEGWTVANPVFFNWIHSFLRSCLVSSRARFSLSFLRILHCFFFCPSTCPLAAAAPEAGFSSCLSREDKCFSRKCLFQVTGHAPESFPDRIILASMFNDITNWKSPTVQTMCLAQAREVASYATRFRPRCWVSVVQDRERPGHIMSVDHVTNLLTVNGTNSLSR